MRRAAAVALALLVAGCPAEDGGQRPRSVVPDHGVAGARTPLLISGDLRPLVQADFVEESASALDAELRAQFASSDGQAFDLEEVRLLEPGRLHAVAPAALRRGLYDLIVEDTRGRRGRLAAAYRALAGPETVAAFRFAPIGPQRAGVPFTVTLTAVDAEGVLVDGFEGSVELSDATGTLKPLRGGPFVRGTLQLAVSVGAATQENELLAADELGRTGRSARFAVLAGIPIQVGFASVPASVVSGECARFSVEARDSRGGGVPVEKEVEVKVHGAPWPVELFADDTCSVPLQALSIEPSGAPAVGHFKASVAGEAGLRLVPATLAGAYAPLRVVAGPPKALRVTTPPRSVAAGACSPEVEVAAVDAFGNRAALDAEIEVAIASRPAGLSFFADRGCRHPQETATLAGEGAARFHFKGALDGIYAIELEPRGPPPLERASQHQQVGQ
ncbi:MAG: hypothetical protein ACOX6T_02365 [Myxococcales bacterium]|jgi:hypothetical protein